MSSGILTNIKIAGIACVVPDNRKDLIEYYDKFGIEKVLEFSRKTGVNSRCISFEEQTSSDLCYVAAERLIEHLDYKKESFDVVIFITQTPDYRLPASACLIHKRLGLKRECIAFDVNLGCSGYVFGIHLVASIMQHPSVKRGLLLAGDTMNKVVSNDDRSTAMLFGDSGSATILERTDKSSDEIKFSLKTDGKGFKHIIVPSGAFRNRNDKTDKYEFAEGIIRSDYDLFMSGLDVFEFTVYDVADSINEFCDTYHIQNDNIDMYVLHQANIFILKNIAKRTHIPLAKLPISMDIYGNTSVTSIPLTICDACERQKLEGDIRLLCSGFGVGLSWGIITMLVNAKNCLPIFYSNDYYTDGRLEKIV